MLSDGSYYISWLADSSPIKYSKARIYYASGDPKDLGSGSLQDVGNVRETCVFKHVLKF